jgi:hypothetical protein
MAPRLSLFLLLLFLALAACSSIPPLPPKAIELNADGAAALAAGDLTTAEARGVVPLLAGIGERRRRDGYAAALSASTTG